MTKDERFLLELYRRFPQGKVVDPIILGKSLGYSDRQIQTIVKDLLKTNFIKKIGEGISLTKGGEELAKKIS